MPNPVAPSTGGRPDEPEPRPTGPGSPSGAGPAPRWVPPAQRPAAGGRTPADEVLRASSAPAPGAVGQAAADDEVDVRAYLAVLKRRWRVILAVVLVVVALGVGRALLQPEVYRATSTLLVRAPAAESVVGETTSRNTQQIERELNNEVEQLRSDDVVVAVRKAYEGPLDPSKVKASLRRSGSDVIAVTMTGRDADEAARLVNLYVDTFIDTRRAAQVDELLATGDEVQEHLAAIETQVEDLSAPLVLLEAQVTADPENEGLVGQRDDLRDEIAPELARLDRQRTFYEQQLESLQLSAQIAGRGGIQVLTKAQASSDPVSPTPVRDGGIALVLGLMLGVAAAFLVDNLDERIRSTDDLERAAGGLPTLALIPEYEIGSDTDALVLGPGRRQSPAAEAFRSLRTSVRFASLDHPIRVLQVTSASDREGKTTTAANLAMAFAQGGDRVAVVGCDLRRPRLHALFGVDLTPGLTDILVDDAGLTAALHRIDDSVVVLPAGSPPPNPSELLSTDRTEAVISALANELDLVVLDCSPVLPVTDALVLSRLVDATIVVANGRRTKRNALRRTIQQLRRVNAPVLGLVLNGAPGGEGYGYDYQYESTPDRTPPRRSGRSGADAGPDGAPRPADRVTTADAGAPD